MPSAIAHLWTLAKELINTLFRIYGEPQEIAACGAVTRKTHRWLTAWLIACETLLRRLLLIEAQNLGAPAPPPARSKGKTHTGSPETFSLNPDDWRVSFRTTQTDRRLPAGKVVVPPKPVKIETPCRLEAGCPSQHHPALPLAHRAEALYRVAKNPLPYARRLARMLARIPQAVTRVLAPPSPRKRKSGDPPNARDIIGHEAWAELDLALNSS